MPSGVYKHPSQCGFQKGQKHWNWKGNKITYYGLHAWLKINFGKANKCESNLIGLKCKNISTYFNWSKLKNKKYERKRENFIMLCRKCHMIYDNLIIAGWNKGKKIK